MTVGSRPRSISSRKLPVQHVVREAIATGEVRTAHDVSLGGLAVAIAEMAIHSGIGAMISTPGGQSQRRLLVRRARERDSGRG